MRLFRSVALTMFAVASLSLSACAANTDDEESGASSDALTQAKGFAYVDGVQVKSPADSSAANPVIGGVNKNSRILLYCKAVNAGGTYLGSNVRSTFAMSYVKDLVSNVNGCLDANNRSIDCPTLVASLPPCAPTAAPGGGNDAGPVAPAPNAKLLPPAGAHTFATTNPPLLRAGYFNEPVNVHSTSKATFDVGAVWNAFDASHRIVGQQTCHETRAFTFTDSSGSLPFDCWGEAVGATTFEVVYYATGLQAGDAHL